MASVSINDANWEEQDVWGGRNFAPFRFIGVSLLPPEVCHLLSFIKQTSEVVEIYRRHRHLLCTAVVNTVYPITSKWTVYFYFYLMASRLHLLFYLRVNIK